MKITSSAMLVAWSPMRSRWRDTRIRSSAGSMVAGSLASLRGVTVDDRTVSLDAVQALAAAGLSLVPFAAVELTKAVYRRRAAPVSS